MMFEVSVLKQFIVELTLNDFSLIWALENFKMQAKLKGLKLVERCFLLKLVKSKT